MGVPHVVATCGVPHVRRATKQMRRSTKRAPLCGRRAWGLWAGGVGRGHLGGHRGRANPGRHAIAQRQLVATYQRAHGISKLMPACAPPGLVRSMRLWRQAASVQADRAVLLALTRRSALLLSGVASDNRRLRCPACPERGDCCRRASLGDGVPDRSRFTPSARRRLTKAEGRRGRARWSEVLRGGGTFRC